MRKILLGLAFVLGFSSIASANEQIRPYIGLDYVYSKADIDKIDGVKLFKDGFNSFSINAGNRFNKNFGLEAFYQKSSTEKKKFFNGKTEANFYAFGVDAVGFLPLDCSDKIELLGAFGIGYYDVDAKVNIYSPTLRYSDSESGAGYRFGAGAQYNFDKNWSAIGIGRYVLTDLEDIDGLYELSLGVKYNF